MPSQNEMHDNKFKRYSQKNREGKSIPEEDEFQREDTKINNEIATMNNTLGKFTKTFYSHRSIDSLALKKIYSKETNIQLDDLTNILKSKRENKSQEGDGNKLSLFSDNGQLKQDIAKTVVHKEPDSILGMLSKSHSKAK